MEHKQNSESRRDYGDEHVASEAEGHFFDDEEDDFAPGADGLPSPHRRPGEPTWVEAELERRAAGQPPRHSLPGEPPLPHEVPPPREPKRTGTGLFYKNGDEIPPTHPDHGPMHLLPRQEDGSFSAFYYCSKEELADFAIPGPPPRRHRHDGWSAQRQEQFVEALAASASWTDAARAVDRSRTSAYNLYNHSPAFRAACDEALKPAAFVLATTAFDRAVNGVEEIVYHQGQRVGVRWKYDNKLLMQLLRSLDPLRFAPLSEIEGWLKRRGVERTPEIEGALDQLAAAEAQWGSRLPGEGAAPDPALMQAVRPGLVEGRRPIPLAEPADDGPSSVSPAFGEAAHPSTSSISPACAPADASTLSTSSTSTAEPAADASTLSTLQAVEPAAPAPGEPPS